MFTDVLTVKVVWRKIFRSSIKHDKLNVLGYSSEKLIYQFSFSSGMMKVLSKAFVQGKKECVNK